MEIEAILKNGLDRKASDVHIVAGLPPAFRIDGDLIQSKDFPVMDAAKAKQVLYEIMTEEQRQRYEKQLALDMAIHFDHLGNFRVNVFHQNNGMGAVIRIVTEHVPTLDEIGAPPILKRLLMLPHGIILVTGATGSGKSTTMASMVDYVNRNRSDHIITIEDPIEYIHKSNRSTVNQLQVGRDTKSFAAALRSALRQDPDIIMLGEMRDLESIRLALTAAETGHLVLSTLHASTAPITISRIVDVFPTAERNRVRNILSETIQGVVCQALVKKLNGGRTAAYEILLATPAVRHLISQGMNSHLESTMQTSGDQGMFTMETYLKDLINKNIVSKTVGNTILQSRDALKFAEANEKNKMGTGAGSLAGARVPPVQKTDTRT